MRRTGSVFGCVAFHHIRRSTHRGLESSEQASSDGVKVQQ